MFQGVARLPECSAQWDLGKRWGNGCKPTSWQPLSMYHWMMPFKVSTVGTSSQLMRKVTWAFSSHHHFKSWTRGQTTEPRTRGQTIRSVSQSWDRCRTAGIRLNKNHRAQAWQYDQRTIRSVHKGPFTSGSGGRH